MVTGICSAVLTDWSALLPAGNSTSCHDQALRLSHSEPHCLSDVAYKDRCHVASRQCCSQVTAKRIEAFI